MEQSSRWPTPVHGTRGEGFTLIELLVVMSLMVIMAGLAMPVAYRNMSNYRARVSAREVGTTLSWARDRAVASRIPNAVLFDEEGGRYILVSHDADDRRLYIPEEEREQRDSEQEPSGRLAEQDAEWNLPAGYSITLRKELQNGVEFSRMELTEVPWSEYPAVVFDPRGYSSGATITLAAKKHVWRITLTRAGGRVRVERVMGKDSA